MIRYTLRDPQGRKLYQGETINGRAWAPARGVGWLPGILMALGTTLLLTVLLGVPLPLALIASALVGQMMVNRMQRSYSRLVYATEDAVIRHRAEVEPPEARARREKIAAVRLAVEADLPYLDFDSGEVWPQAEARRWLADQERDREAHKALDDMNAHLDDADVPARGRQAVARALQRGEISDRSADGWLTRYANDRRRPPAPGCTSAEALDGARRMQQAIVQHRAQPDDSGTVTWLDLEGRPARTLDQISFDRRRVAKAYDLGAVDRIEAQAQLAELDAEADRVRQAQIPHRTLDAVRRDAEQVGADFAAGRIDVHVARSLSEDLAAEAARIRERES